MKILFIDGEDYAFSHFENQTEFTVEEIVKKCEQNGEFEYENKEDEYECFTAKILEFGEVDLKFFDFIQAQMDHDAKKHKNWVIINN